MKNIFFKNRRELINIIDQNNYETAVEVGVREGYYSKYILDNSKIKKLYAIDPWEYNIELANPDQCFKTCQELLSPFGNRVEIIKNYSPQICSRFADNSLDFVYIDALHDYESVNKDIHAWYSKVKNGGILAGHDYHEVRWPGIVQAVNEFVFQNNLFLNLTGVDSPDYVIEHDGWNPSWWFQKI